MDIGLAVGGAFLSSALNVLFDRLAPNGELMKMFQRDKHDVRLLKKLRMTLLALQAVLSDAENKQTSNPYVSQWLSEFRDAVDGAENLIEEVNYEALRLKVEGQHQNLAETINKQVITIKEKLEETIETLEELQKQIGFLDLAKYLDSDKQEKRTFSTSVVDESDIFGRQNEIEELIDRLLSEDANGKNLTVVPIVGMGGVGKTTLAKAVYNDEKVKNHFNLKAWFCVSEPYDALRITKGLLQEIGSFDSKADSNLNQLQVKLKEILKGKRFLIVLDDMWNDNYNEWDDLRNLFVKGDVGSKIIVTTRKESVALVMGKEQISMEILSSEVSWSLFKRHAFEYMDPEEQREFKKVGKQIEAKCKGLPLALKTLAGMLRSKSEVEGWKRILRSEMWELPDNDILPALMLSYNDLPAHLKQCFSYCAIFPKDYPFRKEQVIQLWIANGLLKGLQKDETIEDLGNLYFLELRSRSLFERVRESSKRNEEEFLMHDLINDLAQVASSKLCIRLEDNEGSHMLEKCRHLSYSLGDGVFEKLKPLYKSKQLRTLLPINIQRGYSFPLSKRVLYNILPRLTSLRALSLSHYRIKELPNDLFITLKLLRILDLSQTAIRKLPDSICALYNLEILLLSSCIYLEELPPHMEKLINLRHLDTTGTSLLKMPLHPSKLKNLHVLVGFKFILGGCNDLRMVDLGELHNLHGSISVLELQNVVDRREALNANMMKKEHVEMLSLEWSESIADSSQTEGDILDKLQPNTNIKELEIAGYRGTKFPNWMADHSFLKLVGVSLSNCNNCASLPALGQLPSLKFLTVKGMHRITEVSEEFYGTLSSKKPFNSLEKLEFAEMPEWKQWHVLGKGEFPALHDFLIEDCPKLIGKLPEKLCSLRGLRISKCPELSPETLIQLSNLKEFKVVASPKVGVLFDDAQLFTSQLQGMKQIVELCIHDCHSLTFLPISILPSTLKKIEIYHCRKLKLEASMISRGDCNMFLENLVIYGCDSIDDISPEFVPRSQYLSVNSCLNLTRLLIPTETEKLYIWHCKNLEILSVASGTQTMLRNLSIRDCEKLKWLPECMQELIPSLKELELWFCTEIVSFPEGGLPFNLQVLRIHYCKKLVNARKGWHLQRLPCLRELTILHDRSDLAGENWELPCSIRRLTISNLKTLSSQLFKSLTSLEYLSTGNSLQIQSLLEEGLPTSLSRLTLFGNHELHSLPIEGLRQLTSLRDLFISSCDQLQSIPESALPSSLSALTIQNCHKLQYLPVKGMPTSISSLSIYDCPLLKPLLEFDKGEYWQKIAHISTINIDGEYQ
ncbi:putative disease resistance RPP13-like protein 1 [Solanum verrucosum]|uniref:putative disease resistance RPP13-like protein 1 n=1 Tax=Solanum verrucosum TaxID=315347 RepID=UPI0020D06179|nr:putative disease resistance RPP13-like protein 1 [Solanum verrucosum]